MLLFSDYCQVYGYGLGLWPRGMAWLRGLVMDMAMAMGRVWLWLGLVLGIWLWLGLARVRARVRVMSIAIDYGRVAMA